MTHHSPGQFSIPGTPHVRLTLHECLVQALLLYEALHLASVRLDKVVLPVGSEELHQLCVSPVNTRAVKDEDKYLKHFKQTMF